jgi:hypothetical protein
VDRGESRQAWTAARQTAEISTNFSTVVENLDAVPDIGEEDGIYHRHSPRDNPELTIIAYPPRSAYAAACPMADPIDRRPMVPLPFEVLPCGGFYLLRLAANRNAASSGAAMIELPGVMP